MQNESKTLVQNLNRILLNKTLLNGLFVNSLRIMIIMVISIVWFLIDKKEHTVLYKISQTYKYTHEPLKKKKKIINVLHTTSYHTYHQHTPYFERAAAPGQGDTNTRIAAQHCGSWQPELSLRSAEPPGEGLSNHNRPFGLGPEPSLDPSFRLV